MSILLFTVFGFLWYCVDVLIYRGNLSLPKHFFNVVHVSGIVSHLKFTFPYHFYINKYRFISLFMLIFFTYFCLGISEEDALLVKYLSCKICLSGIQESMIGVVDRNQILFDVTSSDHMFIQPAW